MQLPACQQRPGCCTGAGPTAAVRAQACVNCGSDKRHGKWLTNPDKAVGGRVCGTCYKYYHDHGCPRPRELYERPRRLTAAEAAEMARLSHPPRAVRGSGAPWR